MLEIVDIHAAHPNVVEAARHLLDHALPRDLGDDRFDDRWAESLSAPESSFIGSLAIDGGHPVGLLAGSSTDKRLQLDALIEAHVEVPSSEIFERLLQKLRDRPELEGAEVIEIWGKPAHSWHDAVAASHGFVPLRALHQMRCPLPVSMDGLPTRPFRVGHDEEALRLLNNSSFAGHPDQGNLSAEDFAQKLGEPGVSVDGIRLFEVDGTLAGFCWTKIHADRGLGEIFAIGLHPSQHGRGLGAPMTASGLHWLATQGLDTGMLYVEADNVPAIHTYEKLGFEVVRTDRAWAVNIESLGESVRSDGGRSVTSSQDEAGTTSEALSPDSASS